MVSMTGVVSTRLPATSLVRHGAKGVCKRVIFIRGFARPIDGNAEWQLYVRLPSTCGRAVVTEMSREHSTCVDAWSPIVTTWSSKPFRGHCDHLSSGTALR